MNETEHKTISILLVEDERAHAELSRIALAESKPKIECHAVQTLRQARRIIEKEKPDLVIADLNLPDGKGIELIPPPEERFNHPPCVVITSYGNEQLAVEAMKAGALDYVVKSETMFVDLPHIVRRAMREWELIQEKHRAEEAIRESREEYRRLVESLNEGIWVIDAQARTTFINQRMAEILDYPVDEMIGRTIFTFMDGRGLKLCKQEFERFRDGQRDSHDIEWVRRDGTRIFSLTTFSPIVDEHQEYQGNILSVLDVSARKQMEAAVQAADQKYRELVENINEVVYTVDPNGVLIYMSPVVETMLGYKPQEILGRRFDDFAAIEDADKLRSAFRNVLSGDTKPFEFRIRAKTGDLRWIQASTRPIHQNNKLLGFHGIGRDITEIKKAETALMESEELFRQIFEQTEDAVMLMDDHCEVLDVNPTALSLFGYTLEDISETGLPLLFDPCNALGTDRMLKDCVNNVHFSLPRLSMIRKDGRPILVSVHGNRIRLKGREVIHCVFKDITEQESLLERERTMQSKLIQQNKMASLGTLVSGIAHEINNPTNFIMFNAPLVQDVWEKAFPVLDTHHRLNPEYQILNIPFDELRQVVPKLFSGINEGASRIKGIIETLREFSRPDFSKIDRDVDVNAVIQIAVTMLGPEIKRTTHRFDLELSENLPLPIGSPQQIEQVVINLLTNSLQSLDDPERAIRVSTGMEDGAVFIRVQDEGTGMSESVLDRVFEPFFTTKLESGGTGLGLAISHSIVQEHHGRLEFQSSPGLGTTASVYLPVPHAA